MTPVSDLMTRDVLTFREETPVDEVAQTLSQKHFTGAPVVDAGGHVVGIVSEVDVFSKKGKTVKDIMSGNVIAITEDTPVQQAAELLNSRNIRRLPVLSGGRLVGLVSRSDVLDFFAHSHWVCEACGNSERGLAPPERCDHCGGSSFRLERSQPGC
jgi:CBS domain-containing protein